MGPRAARAFAACALLAILTGAASAARYQAPPLAGHVVDTAGLLSPAEKLALDRRMEEIRRRSGFELVAFLVGSLDDQSIEDVAYGAFNQWGVGRAGQDNGVLLVIAPKERKVRIETGKGVGGALTDVQANDIIERVIDPPLREGRHAEAIAAGVDAIAAALTAGTPAGSVAPAPPPRLSWQQVVLGAALCILLVLMIVSRGFRSAVWSLARFFLLARFFGGGGDGGSQGGSGYSGGGGRSGGGGASGGY